jgi:hypothetical protein
VVSEVRDTIANPDQLPGLSALKPKLHGSHRIALMRHLENPKRQGHGQSKGQANVGQADPCGEDAYDASLVFPHESGNRLWGYVPSASAMSIHTTQLGAVPLRDG